VLVPGPDGKVGTVVVQEGGREIVLDMAYASARTGAGGRLEAGHATPDEVRAIFADALTAVPPRPVAFVLHFVGGTDQLTPASQALVDQILATIATRPAPDLTVAGHTDAVGTDQLNDALSLRRAERVRDLLIARGIASNRIVAVGRGKRELLVPTPDGVAEVRNRRVEITVR
jgi:outer membrane protein OmpA-like peptidoglycan-associated protein